MNSKQSSTDYWNEKRNHKGQWARSYFSFMSWSFIFIRTYSHTCACACVSVHQYKTVHLDNQLKAFSFLHVYLCQAGISGFLHCQVCLQEETVGDRSFLAWKWSIDVWSYPLLLKMGGKGTTDFGFSCSLRVFICSVLIRRGYLQAGGSRCIIYGHNFNKCKASGGVLSDVHCVKATALSTWCMIQIIIIC